ncbi:MAG TPA: hypothetical protein VJL89_03360 [Thermodesulfovibrionia bacterium]|nr:hypothetical protein [Thermodesulfovibrionia bacterium]
MFDNGKSETMQIVQNAFAWLWILVSVVMLCLCAAPLVVSEKALFSASSRLQEHHGPGQTCALCGMTRGYVLAARLRVKEAYLANKGAPFLYFSSLVNGIFMIVWLIRKTGQLFREK